MAYNEAVETFRDVEYPMMKGKTYLDHGGTTIYAKSLIDQFSHSMISNLYGNPHSSSDPAKLSGHVVDSVREKALRFFGADPEHFDLIFTANATAAVKIVAESFRDLAMGDLAVASSTPRSFWYGYHKDCHTSLVGVREYTSGNFHCFSSDKEVEGWLDECPSSYSLLNGGDLPGLFAYPGQSNMTGRRLPLSWTGQLRSSSKSWHQNVYSLLDAAALATTTPLNFADPKSAPDFTALSFYKIFGFPDLGALIVRKDSGHILSWRRYFGGGTVNGLTVLHEATVQRKITVLHESLEDGTLPFHNIIALGCAIDVHKSLYGSMKVISQHTSFLAQRLYNGISNIFHSNGRLVCKIHNDLSEMNPYTDSTTQGATIAFSVVRADGSFIRHSVIEKLANERGIYLRSGGLCNPGGIATYLKVEPWQFKRAWSAGYQCGEPGPFEIINGKPIGVVRASLGAMSTIADVDTFLMFMIDTFVEQVETEVIVLQSNCLGGFNFSGEVRMRKDSGFAPGKEEKISPEPGYHLRQLRNSPTTTKARLHLQRSFYGHERRLPVDQMPPTPPIPQLSQRLLETDKTARPIGDLRSAAHAAERKEQWSATGDRRQDTRQKSKYSLKFWKSRKVAV